MTTSRPPLLLLFVHPAPHASRVNAALRRRAESIPGLVVHDLYATYPDFFIDTAHEHALLEAHRTVVVQHPFYWHSVPALYKEWMDNVLAYGWAYGGGGNRLAGKRWGHALTAGWPESAYTDRGEKRYTINELLRPLEQTVRVCAMEWLSPFVVHHARALSDAELAAECERYAGWLGRLIEASA